MLHVAIRGREKGGEGKEGEKGGGRKREKRGRKRGRKGEGREGREEGKEMRREGGQHIACTCMSHVEAIRRGEGSEEWKKMHEEGKRNGGVRGDGVHGERGGKREGWREE